MNARGAFVRKLGYVVAIAVLLGALNWLFRPAAAGRGGAAGDPGGRLAQLRQQYRLGHDYLGQVDPASETIKLVTLGMRGVAANILWGKAHEYKMKKDWTNLSATLQQLARLQPSFPSVWEFQAWNLSYNVSAEFDDYRERYRWVIKGINFLEEGIPFNQREAILAWDMGWFISQKIGRSDERRQFRKIFKTDDDFHRGRAVDQRDNWLVGREWYLRAEDQAVNKGARMKKKSPLLYRSDPAKCLLNYAEAIETEGTFGDAARRAWADALAAWRQFGTVPLPTTSGKTVRIGEMEMWQARAAELRGQLEALAPGAREKIFRERFQGLTAAQRSAYETPFESRTDEQFQLAAEASERTHVRHREVAGRAAAADRAKALKLAAELDEAEDTAAIIAREREIIAYEFWRSRAEVEQGDDTIRARQNVYEADRAYAEGVPVEAKARFEQAFAAWRRVLDRHAFLLQDRTTIDDLADVVKRYKKTLDQLDEPFPRPFVLDDVLKAANPEGS